MQTALLIGTAGAGKTAECMRLMEMVLQKIVRDPLKIGYVTFTRAGRREASARASQLCDVPVITLERNGYFRTLHSICYKQLGVGAELLSDNKESRQWLEEAMQQPVKEQIGNEDEPYGESFGVDTQLGIALRLWSAARNRLEPLKTTWQRVAVVDERVPDYDTIEQIVQQYEAHKKHDERLDFTDLLGMFSGNQFFTSGPERVAPDGEVPWLTCWFLDEAQDQSALLDAVLHRLVAPSSYVYLTGDPRQSIFGWAGADPACMLGWDVTPGKRRVLNESYRCPERILRMADDMMRETSDWEDYGLVSLNEHPGEVDHYNLQELHEIVRGDESWLVLARTNRMAAALADKLTANEIPWKHTKGGGRAPKRARAASAMRRLETGGLIDGEDWAAVLGYVTATVDGEPMLVRGTKTAFANMDDAAERFPFVTLGTLDELGATQQMRDRIASGSWRKDWRTIGNAANLADRWGDDVVADPQVRVGTIHSAKGQEADNVALLASTTDLGVKSMDSVEASDAEYRTWYVGLTRAKRRVALFSERGKPQWKF